MLGYDRTDVSEGIDINNTNASKKCYIYHYWYFKDIGFKYEPYFYNSCHDVTQKLLVLMILLLFLLKEVIIEFISGT